MARTRFRWFIVFLLFAITVVNYVDRAAIAYAIPIIQRDLGLSPAATGAVLGAFGLGYAMTTLLGGFAVDRYGARAVLTIAAILWSLSIGMTGLATSVAILYTARILLGRVRVELFDRHLAPPQAIQCAVLRHRGEPRAGVVRHALLRPLLERADQRILREFFRQAHVAHHARDRGDDLRGLDLPYRLDGALRGGRGHGGGQAPLRSASSLRKRSTSIRSAKSSSS